MSHDIASFANMANQKLDLFYTRKSDIVPLALIKKFPPDLLIQTPSTIQVRRWDGAVMGGMEKEYGEGKLTETGPRTAIQAKMSFRHHGPRLVCAVRSPVRTPGSARQ